MPVPVRGRVSPSDSSSFSGPAAARIAGISYRRLDYWARKGFITPTVPSGGRGYFRCYSSPDLLALRVAKHLRDQGFNLGTIRRAVKVLDDGRGAKGVLTSYDFLVRGGRILAFPRDGSPPIDIAHGGQLMLAIDLQIARPIHRKGLAKAGRRVTATKLLDESVVLKRRKQVIS